MIKVFVFWLLMSLIIGALYNHKKNISLNWKSLIKWFAFGATAASMMSLIVLIF